jgi:type IV secretory pathway TraG/TraD family ATPase VirD4
MKPVAALIFSYILSRAENRNFEKPLFLCLDEFTNFGRIPNFPAKMSIIRHRNLGTILGFQTYHQLEEVYGRIGANNIWGNTITKVFFKPTDLEFAKKVSEMLGKETVYKRTMSSSGQVQEQEFGKPLMDAGEILAFPKQFALCFNESTSPLKLSTYTWRDFEAETSLVPPKKSKVSVDQRLEKTCETAKTTPQWQKEWLDSNPEKELNYINENIRDTSEEALKTEEANQKSQAVPSSTTETPEPPAPKPSESTEPKASETLEIFQTNESELTESTDPEAPEEDEFGAGAVI